MARLTSWKVGCCMRISWRPSAKRTAQRFKPRSMRHGLEGVMQYRSKDLYGIVNGVDYGIWNRPPIRWLPRITARKTCLAKPPASKISCKRLGSLLIRRIRWLAWSRGWTTRKGLIWSPKLLIDLLKLDVYFILLGTGHEKYHKLFRHIARSIHTKLASALRMTTSSRIKLKPAQICSSCHLVMNPAAWTRFTVWNMARFNCARHRWLEWHD